MGCREGGVGRERGGIEQLGAHSLLRSRRWQTNTAMLARDDEALVCDPSWTPAEIAALASAAQGHGPVGVTVLVTHAHEDHVCGLGAFAGETIVAGRATAAAIRSGAAAVTLASASVEWGLVWSGTPFVTMALAPGAARAGAWPFVAIDAPGHSADGTAWLLPDDGFLLPGDYLSAVTPPLVLGGLAAYRATLRRLLDLLGADASLTVVPGHGPVLTSREARVVGEADLRYLDALDAAAARLEGRAPGDALVALWRAVDPPREAIADFAIYDLRTLNARAALQRQ